MQAEMAALGEFHVKKGVTAVSLSAIREPAWSSEWSSIMVGQALVCLNQGSQMEKEG